MSESIRLAKHLADLRACSRREAENYIEGGWVSVDGKIVEEPGCRIDPRQSVVVAPNAKLEDVRPVTLLLNKPAGFGANDDDESAASLLVPENFAPDDQSAPRLLKKHLQGLVLATPLETGASGLIVATQEYTIGRKLMDDAGKVEQEFVVEVNGTLSAEGLKRLNHGLSWDGKPIAPMKVSWQSERRLRFALKTPPVGMIADMCQQVGLEVTAMKRIRIGRLPMATLPEGKWRYLRGYERF